MTNMTTNMNTNNMTNMTTNNMTTKVGAISSLFLEQEIIMFLRIGQEPAIGLTTGLVVDPTEVGDHIHSIM